MNLNRITRRPDETAPNYPTEINLPNSKEPRRPALASRRTRPLLASAAYEISNERENPVMASAADDIIEMITDRTSHTGGSTLQLSEPLENLGLDSLQVVELIFDIEEKFNINIPVNANMDIESKTIEDLIQVVDQLVFTKAKAKSH